MQLLATIAQLIKLQLRCFARYETARAILSLAPDLFSVHDTGYNIRNSKIRLNIPQPRTDYTKKRFCYSARKCQSLPELKKKINKYYDNLI